MADSRTKRDLHTAHVLYMDLVESSTLAVEDVADIWKRLEAIVDEALNEVVPNSREAMIPQPTGDGMGLAFFGDPSAPVEIAILLNSRWPRDGKVLRLGIHSGTVEITESRIQGTRACHGDGIVMARRVMATNSEGRIMMTEAYVARIKSMSGWSSRISPVGERATKAHEPPIFVYEIVHPQGLPPLPVGLDAKDRRIALLDAKIEQLEAQRRTLLGFSVQTLESFSIVEAILRRPRLTSREALSRELDAIMQPFVREKDVLFNGKGVEFLYSFAIYLYNVRNRRLEVAWRVHHPDLVPRNRSWSPGEGFVGYSFAEARGAVIPDVASLGDLFQSRYETDTSYYRSIGIEVLHKGAPAAGCIVVTSDRTDQLDEAHDPIMEMIAQSLGYYLTSRRGLRNTAETR